MEFKDIVVNGEVVAKEPVMDGDYRAGVKEPRKKPEGEHGPYVLMAMRSRYYHAPYHRGPYIALWRSQYEFWKPTPHPDFVHREDDYIEFIIMRHDEDNEEFEVLQRQDERYYRWRNENLSETRSCFEDLAEKEYPEGGAEKTWGGVRPGAGRPKTIEGDTVGVMFDMRRDMAEIMKKRAVETGSNRAEVLRKLAQMWIDGEIKLSQQE